MTCGGSRKTKKVYKNRVKQRKKLTLKHKMLHGKFEVCCFRHDT